MEGIQKLVEHGHPWLSIQQYTLSEIGCFLGVITKKESQEKAERISEYWCGNHLSHKGLSEMIDGIYKKVGIRVPKEPNTSVEEVNNDWKRLAAFMKGKK